MIGELTKGRPEQLEGRTEREIRVYDLLDKLQLDYEYLDHEMAMTMEGCVDIDRKLNAVMCKNLFLCNSKKDQYYLLMIVGEKKFRSTQIASQIGSTRLSFGDEVHLLEMLDLYPGSVSSMGLMNDHENQVQLLIDEDLLKGEYFGCHPCVNTTSMRISVKNLMEEILPAMNHSSIIVQVEG